MGTKYCAKILRVDLDTLTTSIEDVEEVTLRKYIGGSGLGAKILWEETSADKLPQRFYGKPSGLEDLWNIPTAVEKHLKEYYSLKGWSSEGVPKQKKRDALRIL